MRAIVLPLAIGLFGLSTACVNTDAAVFVEPAITEPAATVSGGALGLGLKGSFGLKLHLGPRASGPSQVDLGAASISDATPQMNSIVDALPGVMTSPALPVTVDLDSDVAVSVTFDTGATTISSDLQSRLCDPGGVKITGSIKDSLESPTATPFSSAVFHPTGCM